LYETFFDPVDLSLPGSCARLTYSHPMDTQVPPSIPRTCGAKTRHLGTPCANRPAKGATRCRFHGGATPNSKRAAERRLAHAEAEKAVQTYGLSREIGPEEALLEEVHWTAGHVAWLRQVVADLERKGLKQYATGEGGALWERPSVWVELYQKERSHLVGVCKAAIAAGIAERAVRLEERRGELVAELLRVAIEAAKLSPDQQAAAYGAIRGHLTRVA
jgi:hypothetical protein